MFGAIYVGLSGLGAYSNGLRQISNNVTNLNTSGFRGQTVTFQNYAGMTDQGGLSFAREGQGAGGGVGNGRSQIDLTQGELRQTDRDLDLTVDGSGFLVLFDGSETLYTTTGSFSIDGEGYIVLTGTNYRLATLDASNRPVPLSIDQSRSHAPKPTTTIRFAGNLSTTSTDSYSVSNIKVHDASGTTHVWRAQFTKHSTEAGRWEVKITDASGDTVATTTLKFIAGTGLVDPSTARLDITDADSGLEISLDFSSGVNSWTSGNASTLSAASVDGYPARLLTSVTVNPAGQIELAYSNEQKVQMGAVAIADFRDPQQLTQRGGSLFAMTGNGMVEYLASADPRVGQVVGRRLEASNVDLSRQFGDLILIQRGFQASSQIVSVSNDMIQQLFGIRGQG